MSRRNSRSTLVGGPLKDTEADIKVTVSQVQEQELPELDDEFAQQASEFDTFAEMRADFEESLLRLARLDQASKARDAVLEDLIEKVDVEVPENLREADLATRKESITNQLASANLSLADIPGGVEGGRDRGGVLGRPGEAVGRRAARPDHLGQGGGGARR